MNMADDKPPSHGKLILGALFLLTWGGPGLWTVCYSNVLRAHGLEAIIPYGFALNAIAVFISPLFVGAMADHSVSPARLLRYMNWGAAAFLALSFLAIDLAWGPAAVLSLMLGYALCMSPNFSLVTTIALAQLPNPSKEFGPIRIWATVGWALAGWIVSWVLQADSSTLSGYAAAGTLAAVGVLTFRLPDIKPVSDGRARTWKERMGLDALALLKNHDHRVVFITTALFSIPLAAFFPFTPMHLKELGDLHPAATMSLGQISEILCLLLLARLFVRVRLKWIFLGGILFGLLRFSAFALDGRQWVVTGVSLHGLCYTLFFITGQIYLAERIEKGMQARAQALLSLMSGGVGNLAGYLCTGWWREACLKDGATQWSLYWSGLAIATAVVGVGFFLSYQGLYTRFFRK